MLEGLGCMGASCGREPPCARESVTERCAKKKKKNLRPAGRTEHGTHKHTYAHDRMGRRQTHADNALAHAVPSEPPPPNHANVWARSMAELVPEPAPNSLNLTTLWSLPHAPIAAGHPVPCCRRFLHIHTDNPIHHCRIRDHRAKD